MENNVIGLYSKRKEYYCDSWPEYYKSAKGIEITTPDNKKYLDFSSMGIGACVLGYANKWVDKAVRGAIKKGSFCSLVSENEKKLANELLSINTIFNKVRFFKTSGEALLIALELAKGSAKKTGVIQCGYSGNHIERLGFNKFKWNDTESIFNALKTDSGIIILESQRYEKPSIEFLEMIKDLQNRGFILIMDEVTAGFRFKRGGAYSLYGLFPDIVVYGKSLSNGYALSALLTSNEIEDAASNKFISSTFWTDGVGISAALKTLEVLKHCRYSYLSKVGEAVRKSWERIARLYLLPIEITNLNELCKFDFKSNNLEKQTYFTERMLDFGFLATNYFYPSFAHNVKHIVKYIGAVNIVFKEIALGRYTLKGKVKKEKPV